ncbi:YcxB family protein [Spirosoma flavum]|uniref:YcxB family protein n=1 Tax=Spirosoma flavum TaxID=2048557 RepID=A0ABW6AJ71_9BACT
MIETTFKLTEHELYKGLLAISRSRITTKTSRIFGIFITLVSISVLYGDIMNNATPSLYSVLLLLFGLYSIFLAEISSKIQARSLMKKKAQITESSIYIFDETSYQLSGESFSTRMTYNKLFEVREVRDFILLRVTEGSANILPKRALSADQFTSLKQIVMAVPNLKLKLKG